MFEAGAQRIEEIEHSIEQDLMQARRFRGRRDALAFLSRIQETLVQIHDSPRFKEFNQQYDLTRINNFLGYAQKKYKLITELLNVTSDAEKNHKQADFDWLSKIPSIFLVIEKCTLKAKKICTTKLPNPDFEKALQQIISVELKLRKKQGVFINFLIKNIQININHINTIFSLTSEQRHAFLVLIHNDLKRLEGLKEGGIPFTPQLKEEIHSQELEYKMLCHIHAAHFLVETINNCFSNNQLMISRLYLDKLGYYLEKIVKDVHFLKRKDIAPFVNTQVGFLSYWTWKFNQHASSRSSESNVANSDPDESKEMRLVL